jgi:hypothetical protein
MPPMNAAQILTWPPAVKRAAGLRFGNLKAIQRH